MIASSLLTAMEDITMTMMQSINTTGVSRIEQPNMGMYQFLSKSHKCQGVNVDLI